MPGLAQAQTAQAPDRPQVTGIPISALPVPGELEMAKLLWSTMAAVDHANQSGNYSVLRDISSPSFQVNNNAAQLAEIFRGIREARVDLSNTLVLSPSYTEPPAIVEPQVMRVRGYFGLRPTFVFFDLRYQWVSGRWRLHGIALSPSQIASEMPGGTRGADSTR
ncbi:MAG: hypothetical protein R3E02_01420 [Blastomonas sp.]